MRRLTLSPLAALAVTLTVGGFAAAQSPCVPNMPQDQPPPNRVMGAKCKIVDKTDAYKSPILTVWPMAGTDLNGDVLDTGIPFYVEGDDQDKYILECVWGDVRQKIVDSNDKLRYTYTINPGNLPAMGTFRSGTIQSTTWRYPAAVYHPPRPLPDGTYNFSIDCLVADVAGGCKAKDWPYGVHLTWQIKLDVADCRSKIDITPPVPPAPTGGPITPKQGQCCSAAANWLVGPAIKPTSNAVLPPTVQVGEYVVFALESIDYDYLYRICDDNPPTPDCPDPAGVNADYLTCEDRCIYAWSNVNVSGGPAGTFHTGKEFAILWQASKPGVYQICQQVSNPPGQAADTPVIHAKFPHKVRVQDRIHKVESMPAFSTGWTTLDFCSAIELWENGDDDNQDGMADNAAGQVPGENDMHALRLSNTSGAADPSMKIRFRVTGNTGSINLFGANDRSQPIQLNSWQTSFPGMMTLYVEGVTAHQAPNEAKIHVDVNDVDDVVQIDVTVFGVVRITHQSDNAPDGKAQVFPWTMLHETERPAGFADAMWAANRYFVDPGADPATDSPNANHNWTDSHRNIVQSEVRVTPAKAGVKVYLSSRDVDDNSYTLWGAGVPTRDFLDPDDRDPAALAARRDNNDHPPVGLEGNVQDPSAMPPVPTDVLTLMTDAQGMVNVELILTFAPGDNFRLMASLAPDVSAQPLVGDPPIIAKVPMDYAMPLSDAAEREAKLIFRRVAGTAAQAGALDVPETGTGPIMAGEGKHTLCGPLITVRRRVHVESLEPGGIPPATWNFDVDPTLENGSATITRYVTWIEEAGAAAAPFPHRELLIVGKTGAPFQPLINLQRRSRLTLFQTDMLARPLVAIGPADADADQSVDYGAPRSLLMNRPPPLAVGPFQGGQLALAPGVGTATILASGHDTIYIASALSIPFEVQTGGGWAVGGQFTTMRPVTSGPFAGMGSELNLTAPLAAPLPAGTVIRVGAGGSQAGVPGVGAVLGGTVNQVIVGNAANGDWFRFPVLLYDDTAWDFRARAAPMQTAWDITTTVNGVATNLVNYFLRDTCVAVRRLDPPYMNAAWGYHHNVPVMVAGGATWDDFYRQSLLAESHLLIDLKPSQDRCWVSVVFGIPDGLAGNFAQGFVADNDCNGEVANWYWTGVAPGGLPVTAGALEPESNFPFTSLHPRVAYDTSGYDPVTGPPNYWVDGPYGGGPYPAISRIDLFRAKLAVHELLHHCLPNPMPTAATGGAGWNLYDPIVNPNDEHTVPGITNYSDVVDPVASPTVPVQGSATVVPGGTEALVSPHTVRTIKETLLAPSKMMR